MNKKERIPIHDIESSMAPVQVRKLAHKNHYNFQRIHRHNYFEVIFFQVGGGKDLIDFQSSDVKNSSCHIVYPGQTHLLQRAPNSSGTVIQFQLESVSSVALQQLLQERAWSDKGAIVFEENEQAMAEMMRLVEAIEVLPKKDTLYWKESQKCILQALLFQLCSFDAGASTARMNADFYAFQQLVDNHFREAHSVTFYINKLPISEKRLAALSKTHLGVSPLQVIHRRIVLEAKRLLLLGEQPHKEIAIDLGFDSPASFSAFVKRKTGLNASEIQAQVAEIHK